MSGTQSVLLQRCYRSLDATFGLESNWQITEREFLGQIFSHVDLRGTRIAPPPAAGGAPPR